MRKKRDWRKPSITEVTLDFAADVLQTTCPTVGDTTPHGVDCGPTTQCKPSAS